MSLEDYHYLFKFVLIGDSGVGKSSFLTQYISEQFLTDYEQTIGVEFESKVIELDDGTLVQNQIWDTSGDQQFRSIQTTFCKNSTVVLLFYKINSHKTFESLPSWLNIIAQVCSPQVLKVLIGTHFDLEADREVSVEEGRAFAQDNNMKFFEISNREPDTIAAIVQSQAYNIGQQIKKNIIDPTNQVYGIKVSREHDLDEQKRNSQATRKASTPQKPDQSPQIPREQQPSPPPATSSTINQHQNQQQPVQQSSPIPWFNYLIPVLIAAILYIIYQSNP